MTREEAIEQLHNCKDLIKQDGQDYLDERDFPLLDMAIEALSAEPNCKDCKKRNNTTFFMDDGEDIDMATEALSALPSAEAEETVLNKMLEEEMIVLPQDYVKVVRCKDCCHRVHDEERGLYYCEMYYGQGDVSDENFCQCGERRK